MDFALIAFLIFLTNNSNYARECNAATTANTKTGDAEATEEPVTTNPQIEEIKDLLKNKNAESAAELISKMQESRKPLFGGSSIKLNSMNKAYSCSKIECSTDDKIRHVCACNFNTGNVASFKNKCDSLKHNCRFDTNFQVILEDICPWEFAFRRAKGFQFDYRDSKYYN